MCYVIVSCNNYLYVVSLLQLHLKHSCYEDILQYDCRYLREFSLITAKFMEKSSCLAALQQVELVKFFPFDRQADDVQ